MIFTETGKIIDGFYITGSAAAPVYLLDGDQPVLFDAGFSALAFQYEIGIKAVLKDRAPAFLFLTHSHFDHVGSAGYFKKIWPDLKIGGSSKSRDVLSNPKAVQSMQDLSRSSLGIFKGMGIRPIYEHSFESVAVDILVTPDTPIKLSPDLSIVPLHTPGHTRDFLSYWIPEKKILIASESVAVYEVDGKIQTEFLVDADAYIDSLEKIHSLGASVLCAGHYAVFTDADAMDHIRGSINTTRDYVDRAHEYLTQANGDIEQAAQKFKATDWDPRPWPKQSEPAYLINTRQRLKVIQEGMQKKKRNTRSKVNEKGSPVKRRKKIGG